MRILFDHNVPHKLRHSLPNHEVRTADETGWAELENGDLLAEAELAGFDVMVTGDKNLSYQQNPKDRKLALIVLGTNNWNIIKRNPGLVVAAIEDARPGGFQVVNFEHVSRRRN